jgi:hypothetical protein
MTLWRFSGAMHNIHQLLRPILPVPHFPATVTLQICSQREWFVTILDTKYVLQRTVLEHDVLVPYASDFLSYLLLPSTARESMEPVESGRSVLRNLQVNSSSREICFYRTLLLGAHSIFLISRCGRGSRPSPSFTRSSQGS